MVSRIGLHRDQYHRYSWGSSQPQPGVTSVMKVQDAIRGADGLMVWHTNEALDYLFRQTYETPVDPQSLLAASLRSNAQTAANAARDRGTAVHLGIESMIARQDYTPTALTLPYWYGLSAFLIHEQPEIIASEQMVINLTAGFGGTLDLIARLRGQVALIDVKTGEPKPEHALQLAGYAAGEWMGQPDDPAQVPLPEFDAHYVLALMPEAPYYELVPLVVDKAATEHFLYLAETYHRLKTWSKAA